jgi:hypothetical protein
MTVIVTDYTTTHGIIPIVARSGDELVYVKVVTRKGKTNPTVLPTPRMVRQYKKQMSDFMRDADLDVQARYDQIDLLVLAEDRALLRHHQDAVPFIKKDAVLPEDDWRQER